MGVISPGGAGRNRVMSKKDFLKLRWFLPDIDEQKKIAELLSNIDEKVESIGRQLEQAQSFKKFLLQQMFI